MSQFVFFFWYLHVGWKKEVEMKEWEVQQREIARALTIGDLLCHPNSSCWDSTVLGMEMTWSMSCIIMCCCCYYYVLITGTGRIGQLSVGWGKRLRGEAMREVLCPAVLGLSTAKRV